jgi:DNA-binding HxlR family transcriptional regulator
MPSPVLIRNRGGLADGTEGGPPAEDGTSRCLGHLEGTVDDSTDSTELTDGTEMTDGTGRGRRRVLSQQCVQHAPAACRAREVLDRIGDKWSLYVIALLGDETLRFTELLRSIDGISQRMLTVTLRGLERDGLVRREVHAVVPPRVEYSLTPLGATLQEAVGALVDWAGEHLVEIDSARARYDDARVAEAG